MTLNEYRFGAHPQDGGVLFRVWSSAERLELVLHDGNGPVYRLPRETGDIRELFIPNAKPGTRYAYLIDGQGPFPDPASRYQPDGVHGFSEVIDPAYPWTDHGFDHPAWHDLIFYELHVGTFTQEGTYAAAQDRLPYLRDLGISAVELMPLGDAPGRWNWGYDGVALYAPNCNYGRPEDLRAFVDAAHGQGIAVYLDVVYNHLGPDGAYHRLFHPAFYAHGIHTPWGDGLNFDQDGSEFVRAFFIENALHWRREYHVDGFRLDATHAIEDRSESHFLKELAERVHSEAEALRRPCLVIAEDSRNLITLLEPASTGGYALDGVWADDFHHHVRRGLAGDAAGYFSDFTGTIPDIVRTLQQGWFFTGEYSRHGEERRGTPTRDIARQHFIICIQNHDQIGNRACGERLSHQIDQSAYLAASALLLFSPETPLLFMGQEWGASSPFQYFTDHNEELGRLVSEGRREEFKHFPAFSDPEARMLIPDPQARSTFERSKLRWDENRGAHYGAILAWYRDVLGLRREIRARASEWRVWHEAEVIWIEWRGTQIAYLCAVALREGSAIAHPEGGVLRLATPFVEHQEGRTVLKHPGSLVFQL